MISLTSYQAHCSLGEGRAHGYMKKHRKPGSATFDIKCFTAKAKSIPGFSLNESSAVVFRRKATKIDLEI